MLFPDWANAQEIQIRTDGWDGDTYTVTQDSFLIGLYSEAYNVSPAGLLINGKKLFRGNTATVYNYYPCFYCAKGTVLKNDSKTEDAFFKVIPLVKSGGGGHKYPVVFLRSYQLNNMGCINRIKFKKRA